MPCFHPLPAWRSPLGVVTLREPRDEHPDHEYLRLPCGSCIGCRKSRAREWALRCSLEVADHEFVSWCTLTYSDEHLPPTLRKDHLQAFFRRLRKLQRKLDRRLKRPEPTRVRFFASGEYGETSFRPHYHAILYGIPCTSSLPEAAWVTPKGEPRGFVRVDPISPAAISYVAGYCSKKIGWRQQVFEHVDYRTGELYVFQPPFVQMSRRPGIGASARRFVASWRSHAIHAGSPMPVPRYLHAAWLSEASDEAITQLKEERSRILRDVSRARLEAGSAIAASLHAINASKRTKL